MNTVTDLPLDYARDEQRDLIAGVQVVVDGYDHRQHDGIRPIEERAARQFRFVEGLVRLWVNAEQRQSGDLRVNALYFDAQRGGDLLDIGGSAQCVEDGSVKGHSVAGENLQINARPFLG